jgi:hypothetical protein
MMRRLSFVFAALLVVIPVCAQEAGSAHYEHNGQALLPDPDVKGGMKLDHWGGGKLDQMSVWEMGLAGRVASGAEACGPVCRPRLGRSGRCHPPREM